MKIARIRMAAAGVAAVTLVSVATMSAGASLRAHAAPTAKLDTKAAALVPAAFKGGISSATDASYPPDESIDGNGNVVGFDIDLINAIGTTLGVKVTTSNVTFDNIIPGIAAGNYGIGNSSFTDTMAREKSVNFVDYFVAGEAFYKKASNTKLAFTAYPTSLCGHSVAVEAGTIEETDALTAASLCTTAKKAAVTVKSFDTQDQANLAVQSANADFGFADSQVAGSIVSASHGVFALVGKAINNAPYGIATAKSANGTALAKAIQAALKDLEANGVYKAILTKWGVQAGALATGQIVLNGAKS
jgi:polar amino acid transport system substrate-binding protein